MRTIKYLSLIALLFFSNLILAFQSTDLMALFPNVAQGHDETTCLDNPYAPNSAPKAQFHFSGGEINGTGGKTFDFCSVYDETGGSTLNCDNAEGIPKSRLCNISGNRVTALDLESSENAFKTSNSTISDIKSCNSGDSVTVGEGAYDVDQLPNISFDGNCTLTFSSNHSEYRIKSLSLGNGAAAIFAPGDYYIEELSLRYNSTVYIQGNTRLFVKNHLTVSGKTDINSDNKHTLRIIIYNSLDMEYGSSLGGLVYVQGNALIQGGTLNGRITAGTLKAINATINNIPLDEYIDEVDTYDGPFQFGKTEQPALSGSITFTIPFAEIPKVFLMPTITPSNDESDYKYDNNPDASATATIISVTKKGFTWRVEQPIYNKTTGGSVGNAYGCRVGETCDNPTQPMEIHWIAATAGTHTLSDGRKIIVGSIPFSFSEKRPIGMQKIDNRYNNTTKKEPLAWLKVKSSEIGSDFSVVLNSRQAKANNCFLTSVALPMSRASGVGNRSGTYFMLDTSNATVIGRDNTTIEVEDSNCLPPLFSGLTDNGPAKLVDEEIAYLAATPGVGQFIDTDGATVRYEFSSANTVNTKSSNNIDEQSRSEFSISSQCSEYTSFQTQFDNIPTFIASKVSVNNTSKDLADAGAGVYMLRGDYAGGFLRRCHLNKSRVSVVNDESNTANKREQPRFSTPERYAFVALEKREPLVRTCFTDEFDRTKIGENWLTYVASGSTIGMADGKLRLTEAISNQATATTYQRLFPIIDNIIEIEFDYYSYLSNPNNSYGRVSGDGVALVFSDSTITPKVGAPGAGLGYTSGNNIAGFAGGWLAFGLDDFGNFSGAKNRIRATGANPKFNYLGTSATLSSNPLTIAQSGTGPLYGDRYRFVIDSSTDPNQINISVSRRKQTEDTFKPILLNNKAVLDIKNINASITNDLLLSLTSSTGGAFATHEIDNFKVCALRSKSMGQLIHHFEFEYSDTSSTCAAEKVKITACRNASCSEIVDEEVVTATLKPTNSDSVTWSGPGVSGNTVTFNGGSTTIYLSNTAAGKITFGVTDSTPGLQAFTSYDGTLCRQGAGSLSSAACTVEFKNAALVLDFTVGTNDTIAKKTQEVKISAYKATDDPNATTCGPSLINTEENISFWSEYINPIVGEVIGSPKISVTNNVGTVETYEISNDKEFKKTSIPIKFDDKGEATIKINYPDAGKVQLSVELIGKGADLGTNYNGSGQFVSFPAGLCLTSPDANSACESNDATCSAFKAAGEAFNLRVQAKAWQTEGDKDFCDNPIVTPNYQQDNIVLTHALVEPDGGNLGKLSVNEYTHALGNLTEIPLSISEVGVFTLQAKPPLPYLDSNYYQIKSSSASIGRFYPYSFSLENPKISHDCTDFSYMEQPFTINALIKALNVNGEVAKNYKGSFVRSSLNLTAENNDNGIDLSEHITFSTNNRVRLSSWTEGQLLLGHSVIFKRDEGAESEHYGHYPNLAIGLQIRDGNTLLKNPSINPETAGICGVDRNRPCNALLLGSGNDLRYGRAKLVNTYGSSYEKLQMPAYTEYWNSSSKQWKINEKDVCTVASNYSHKMKDPADLTKIIGSHDDTDHFDSGKKTLYWQTVDAPNYNGSAIVELTVPEYLQWNWDKNEDGDGDLSNPKAEVKFGRYRGHNKIIYRTEFLN